ncbi:DUF4168 domain-containing protein [Sphingobium sp. BHU LFT2]|uniref:DUF4168 domain-containing protein n=1 Tax=Sphingobium sp. BHU LFT2 TaxID=2807634 RepID=UPI001BED0E4B|nr:DUF4168 domain-containing protein [Sphingobium sp. BHU LFT2]MBT2246699.1 DUF4168 domain-containing protein [Sphingobium sp. BHU LFT2]
MKSIKPRVALYALSLCVATVAQAQDAAPPTSPPTTSPPPSPTSTFSDAELEQYVKAALAVQQIQQDTATPDADKQTKMAAAVQSAGLTPEKFNQIATASQSDPALQQRIQAVAGRLQQTPSPQ